MQVNWIYFFGTRTNPTEIFIYGLSLPTARTDEFSLNIEDLGKVGDKRLFLFRSINKTPNVIAADDKINLSNFYDIAKINLREIQFVHKQTFIQSHEICGLDDMVESPISSLTHIKSYYTTEIQSANLDKDVMIALLKLLQKNSKQKFYGEYAKRLGCFEIGEVLPWAEDNIPFHLDWDKEQDKYVFHKDESFTQGVSVALKIYQWRDEKIFEKLVVVPKEQKDFPINVPVLSKWHSHWGYRYSVYDELGELLHEDLCIYIGEIHLSLNAVGGGGGIKIDDAFSRRDKKLSFIAPKPNPIHSVVGDPYESKSYTSIRCYQSKLLELVKDDKISPNEGRWFKKSDNMLSEIIIYINSLLNNAQGVVIIDPYTDGDMMSLIIRMNAQKIKVIASKKSFPKNMLEYHTNKILDFKKTLKANGSGDNSQFFFVSREFHDRFILIEYQDSFQVYCLPNSINAMLKNDDFLILKLNGKVKQQAAEHIDALIELCVEDCEIRIKNDKD